ncbi:MAG: ArsR/SmtB family transcription factor [Anaerolineae bacterium]
MPVEVGEDVEKWRSMISFRTSVIYEMMLSLHHLEHPRPDERGWAEETRAKLDQQLLEDLEFFYAERFGRGILLMELAIDYSDHHDVDGFLDYLAGMEREGFLFYILGRLIPREETGGLLADEEKLAEAISRHYPYEPARKWMHPGMVEAIAEPEGFKRRLVRLWRGYWQRSFRHEYGNYEEAWEKSIRAESVNLVQQEPLEFLKRLSGGKELPPHPIPVGSEWKEIVLVPSCFVSTRALMFFGYGSITVLYDCQMTEERREELKRTAEEIASVAKALDDTTRLEILRLLAQEESIYGQKIASCCGISQPSVSRHLRILRDAGLIEERRMDNRIGYNICWEVVEEFSRRLSDYLRT